MQIEVNAPKLGKLIQALMGWNRQDLADHLGICKHSAANKDRGHYWTLNDARALGFVLYWRDTEITEQVDLRRTIQETMGYSIYKLAEVLGCSIQTPYNLEKSGNWLLRDLDKLGFKLKWKGLEQ